MDSLLQHMITSKTDLFNFWNVECRASNKSFFFNYWRNFKYPQIRFILLLRYCEYLAACKPMFSKWRYPFFKFLKFRLGLRLGFTIPENVFDIGLSLPHYGTIVVNANARVGKYCRLHVCTNIGASGGVGDAPVIGDYVYIAPGAKIYGAIKIADRIGIAANAAVHTSFLECDKLIGGVPAKVIGDFDVMSVLKLVPKGE